LPSTLTRRRRSRCSSASPRSCCCCSAGSASISAHICGGSRGGGSRGRVQARAVEEEKEVQAGAHLAASRRQPLAPFCSACQTWGRCSCWQLNRLRVFSKCRRRRSPLAARRRSAPPPVVGVPRSALPRPGSPWMGSGSLAGCGAAMRALPEACRQKWEGGGRRNCRLGGLRGGPGGSTGL
jgi:hypothetical protein